jgi:mRNA interferase MazF
MVRQGDIVWLDFDPQAGHEQKGRRPALIVSNESFNNFSKLAIVCPITNRDKDHPFHIKLDDRTRTSGVILCDQARTLDINARNFEYIESVAGDILLDVLDIIQGFIEIEKSTTHAASRGVCCSLKELDSGG